MDLSYYAQYADRSRALMRHFQRRGHTNQGFKIWTPEEDELCRRHYPNYTAMQRELPHRTRHAIRR
jgi:hypothetical protein